MSEFAKGINSKENAKATTKKRFFLKKKPGNLLITLYQLSNFGAPSCNVFEISNVLCHNLQRAITEKNKMIYFIIFTM